MLSALHPCAICWVSRDFIRVRLGSWDLFDIEVFTECFTGDEDDEEEINVNL